MNLLMDKMALSENGSVIFFAAHVPYLFALPKRLIFT